MTILKLTWAISRGRDTYGYNICRLDDRDTDKRYRCMGGGYDMIGTVVGDWLEDHYQHRLQALVKQRASDVTAYTETRRAVKGLYGLTVRDDGSVLLDGGCGLSSMRSIAEAICVDITPSYNKKGHTDLFFASERPFDAQSTQKVTP